ncbi:MAG: hypothetical protein FWE05_09070 [Defluviitaleaceae bacterium]|nr:hypothetical protein [Defluviitaleaceae bacterium]
MQIIYYIGGSPCSGKSTVAEMICEKYGFQYYKADDFLMDFVAKGVEDGNEWLTHISEMTPDQLWLRDPQKLNEEELLTYKNLFPYFSEAISKFDKDTSIIEEGAAFLPSLVNTDETQYICIVPTKEFQVKHFSEREWVREYLSSCSDADKAFNNWMERDSLFALSILNQAKEMEYKTLIVDGTKDIEESYQFAKEAFGLQ